ncbi:MAG: hypothetical protein U1E65_28125 [Myxococcota bacterium]
MAESWLIISPLSSDALAALAQECQRAIDAQRAEDSSHSAGAVSQTGLVPSEAEVKERYAAHGGKLSRAILDRLKKARATLSIDDPTPPHESPLQVAALAWLLERCGDALVDLGDQRLFAVADAKKLLAAFPSLEGFEAPSAGKRKAAPVPRASPAELILATFELAEENVDLQIDLKDALQQGTAAAQRYVMLLLSDGAVPSDKAAKKLALSVEEVERAAEEALMIVRGVQP